jgi:ribA/ribD-fused uncharacterized protein
MLRDFFVCHDYGMGGLWWIVTAESEDEILDTFADVTVFAEAPPFFTKADLEDLERTNTNTTELPFALVSLREKRAAHRDDPLYGTLGDRRDLCYAAPRSDGAPPALLAVRDGELDRLINTLDDGTSFAMYATDLMRSVDLRDPAIARNEIPTEVFEEEWARRTDRRVRLVEQQSRSERLRFVHFWSHEPSPGNAVGPWVLSQWYTAPIDFGDDTYPTAEHWLMAAKASHFGDDRARTQILAADHPGEAKAIGREVRSFDEHEWHRVRWPIAIHGNLLKFEQHPSLGDYLVATRDRVLVEASPRDRIWGAGLAAEDPAIDDVAAWPGENLLGFALMEVRALLAFTRRGNPLTVPFGAWVDWATVPSG